MKYSVVVKEDVSKDLRKIENGSKELTRLIMHRLGNKAVAISQRDYLRGQVLNTRSGRLRNSGFARQEGNSVFVGFATKYAAIHEFGGDIYPKRANALRFQVDGRWVVTKHVRMPKRPYAKPAIEQLFHSGTAGRIAHGAFSDFKRRHGIG